jgi:dihydrofolate reductase
MYINFNMNITSVFAGIRLVGNRWLIGVNGSIPWILSADLQHFKSVTMGGIVIMGRKTWDSIPARFKPLTGRVNIIVSRSIMDVPEGVHLVNNVHQLRELLRGMDTGSGVFNIGGAEIYKLLEPYTTKMVVTEVILPYEELLQQETVTIYDQPDGFSGDESIPFEMSKESIMYRFITLIKN